MSLSSMPFTSALCAFASAILLCACDPGAVQQTTGGAGGTGGTGGAGGTGGSGGATVDASDAIFDPEHVVEVAIEMAPADWDALRHQYRNVLEMLGPGCQDKPHESPYTYFPANVTVDGEKLDNSGVRKKGFLGSASLSKPSLKISFDEYEAGREAFGVEGLTLNNSKQDPSFVKTCLAYKVFRDSGGAASRCNFAHVTVNGEDMGVYVHVEPLKKRMLARHFDDNSGNLYEGQLSDFRVGWTGSYEKKTNESDPDRSDLDAVTAALEVSDAELEAALGQVVEIDAFTKFWATEALVAAWDGYTNNLNNHFVYHDPTSGKMFFIPWGPDMSFSKNDPFLPNDKPQSVAAKGTVARRLYDIPAFRKKYVEQMQSLLDTAWSEPDLLAEIDRIQALLLPYLGSDATSANNAANSVRGFVNERRQVITNEISPAAPDWPYPIPAQACLGIAGTVSGTFSTSWGTKGVGDPLTLGDGTFNIEVPLGTPMTATQTNAVAGYENGPQSARQIIVIGSLPDGKTRALVFNVDPSEFVAGKDLPYNWQSVFALGVDVLGANNYPSFGFFADGKLTFDQTSTKAGEPVSGSFSGTLISGLFD